MKLTKREIKNIISNYDIGFLRDYKLLEKGVSNYNWILKTQAGEFVLRCPSQDKEIKDIIFELRYLEYLRKRFHYNLPQPIKNLKNFYITKYKEKLFWLYPFIKGIPLKRYGKRELKEVAKLMVDYHNLLIKSKLKNGKKRTSIINPSVIKELEKQKKICLNKTKKHKNDILFLSVVDELLQIYKNLRVKGYKSLKFYPIHRDINPENVLFSHGKAIAIIDFENVSWTNEPLIKDIAVLLNDSCWIKHKLNLTLAKCFINEYKKYRKLNVKEISLIPVLTISNSIEHFSYAQWLFEHDPQRAKLANLRSCIETSKWFYYNQKMIIRKLK